jgi:hypothetical protein
MLPCWHNSEGAMCFQSRWEGVVKETQYYRIHEVNETRKIATTSELSCQRGYDAVTSYCWWCKECSPVTTSWVTIPALEIGNTWFATTFPSLCFQITEFFYSSSLMGHSVYVSYLLWLSPMLGISSQVVFLAGLHGGTAHAYSSQPRRQNCNGSENVSGWKTYRNLLSQNKSLSLLKRIMRNITKVKKKNTFRIILYQGNNRKLARNVCKYYITDKHTENFK